MMNDDMELVREYAGSQSETAFETLVSRHLNLVYSSALRQVSDAHLAQDIAQAVFIILAQKAKSLGPRTIVSGWLYRATRHVCADALKTRRRRQNREQEAYMQSLDNAPAPDVWLQIAPLLDEAMTRLDEKDRTLIVMRFFENKSAQEIAGALGLEAPAAQKRVTRAVEKLRVYFAKRRLPHTAAVIAEAVSANSVCLAPAGLAKSIAVVAAAKGAAAGGSTLALVEGGLKIISWTRAKAAAAIGGGLLLATGIAYVAIMMFEEPPGPDDVVMVAKPPAPVAVAWTGNPSDYPWQAESFPTNATGGNNWNSSALEKGPQMMEIRPTICTLEGNSCQFSAGTPENWTKSLGMGLTVRTMLQIAYGFSWTDYRTVLETPLPPERYDYIDSLPKGGMEAFREAIKKKFGVTGRIAKIETNVLILRVKNPKAPGLRPSTTNSVQHDGASMGPYSGARNVSKINFINWVNDCERTLQIPIVNRAGLRGDFDLDLKWQWSREGSEKDAFKQAVLEQMGLELAPSRQVIDMLIIERSTNQGRGTAGS
jgi:uncharacterized protein (TIGR03435 family)